MLAILADSANTKFNINEVVSPAGVLFAAVIGGLVAWWNARTSPHGRLQTLIGIYRQWPEGLDGLDTVESSIAVTLARIRHKDGIPAPVTPTASEALAEDIITTARCRQITAIILAGLLVALLITLAVTGILPAQPAGFAASGIFVIILAMTLPFIRK